MFPDLGSTQQQASIIVGFFLPLVLAIPIQSHWKDPLRTAFSVGAYAAAGAITAAAAGSLTGKTFWQCTLTVLALGVVGYKGVWQPSGVALGIETHTNVSDAARAAGQVRIDAARSAANPLASTPDGNAAASGGNHRADGVVQTASKSAQATGDGTPYPSVAAAVTPIVNPLVQVLERVQQILDGATPRDAPPPAVEAESPDPPNPGPQ